MYGPFYIVVETMYNYLLYGVATMGGMAQGPPL